MPDQTRRSRPDDSVPESDRSFVETVLYYENELRKIRSRDFALGWLGLGLTALVISVSSRMDRYAAEDLFVLGTSMIVFALGMMAGKVVPWDEEYRAIEADLGRAKRVQFAENAEAALLNFNRNQHRANSMSTLVALAAIGVSVYSLVVDTRLTYRLLVIPLLVALSFLMWWAILTRPQVRIWSRLERGKLSYREALISVQRVHPLGAKREDSNEASSK